MVNQTRTRLTDWHLAGLLDEAAANYATRPFLLDGRQTLTYQEAITQVNGVAHWLRQNGVRRGDRVLIVTMNRIEAILIAFAVARLGGIFTILNNQVKPAGLRQVLNQLDPVLMVLDRSTASLTAEISHAALVWVGEQRPATAIPFDDLARFPAAAPRDFPGIDLDPACVLFTSGSTGQPRGVVISHDNFRFAAQAIQERLAYRPDDIVGLFLPLSFDYGLYQVFLAALAGAAVFVADAQLAGIELLATLQQYDISVLPGVPSLFAGMLKLLRRHPRALPCLRSVTNTGAHLPATTIEGLQRLFPQLQIFAMYGLTECKRVAILPATELNTRPGSVGRPLPGTEVTIIDEQQRPVMPRTVGQLVVRGRHVTLGYWQAEQETQHRFRRRADGTRELYTGDLCWLDEEGYLYFVGRNDEQLKHKGYRLHPLDVETVACRVSGVMEAGLALAEPDDKLVLFVTLSDPAITARDILLALEEELETYKVPDSVRILPRMPKTPNGKLDRKGLRNLL